MTVKQLEMLVYLAGCDHATTNTIRRVRGGKSPVGLLRRLEARGYVKRTEISTTFMSDNVRWDITEAGRVAVAS